MNAFLHKSRLFLETTDGPTATEYAVLIAIICIGVISALSSFGGHMNNLYLALADTLSVF